MAAGKFQALWTPTFALLCCAQFFGSAQHALLQPTFPLYITSLGGHAVPSGYVLACFAVTSVIFRPLIGGWADRWSETGVLICGLLLLSAAVIFCFIPFTQATMLANALRRLGWAGFNAGGYSLLALSAPGSDAAKPRVTIVECKPAGRFYCRPSRSGLSMRRLAAFLQFLLLPLRWLHSARALARSLRATRQEPLTTGMGVFRLRGGGKF